ncbi:hypothetical protein [Pseudoduganella violacea]|uniref:Uncharacterized protein n=1 Tax=Pseudoduganella violacea TaxID=1715466 RepID=A0A7W5B6R9_9BURK|nr:hypothetical protein [Pseudoduganella violacea]MBB3117567.1 hypothetical protein [Pseudoduganella violacea]
MEVFSVDASHLNPFTLPSFIKRSRILPQSAFAMRGLQFLALRPDSVRMLLNTEIATARTFDVGIRIDANANVHPQSASTQLLIEDAFTVTTIELPNRSYAIYHASLNPIHAPEHLQFPQVLRITLDDIYVENDSLNETTHVISPFRAELITRLQSFQGPHISFSLNMLRSIFLMELAGLSTSSAKAPQADSLRPKLQSHIKSGNQVNAAAKVLANSIQSVLEAEANFDKRIPEIVHLFDCAEQFWGGEYDQYKSRVKVPEISRWLQRRFLLDDHPAKACVALIRPTRQVGRVKKA